MLTVAHLLARAFHTSPESMRYTPLYEVQLRKDQTWLNKNAEDQDAYLSAMLDKDGWWCTKLRMGRRWVDFKIKLATKEKELC